MRVLFVRVPESLLDALDVVVARSREAHRGRGCSRSDIARELLYEEIAKRTPPTPPEAA